MFGKKRIGIDLGTVNTIIAIDRKGIALREPSIVAINKATQEIVAFGKEAQELVGRTSDKYQIILPMKEGVISNFTLTKQMLAYYIKKTLRRSLSKPEVVICVPSNISKLEKKAVIDAVKELGILRAMIVDEPFAAAMGAGLAIEEPKGRLVCDIGGGTTDVATISYGEIVNDYTSRLAGNSMDESIQSMVRNKYQLAISTDVAEELKINLGNALRDERDIPEFRQVSGRHIASGVPQTVSISSELVSESLDQVIEQIILSIKSILEITKPELSVDIMDNGILLTGGGSLLRNLPKRLEKELKIPVRLAATPLDCVALGAGNMIDIMQKESKIRERQKG